MEHIDGQEACEDQKDRKQQGALARKQGRRCSRGRKSAIAHALATKKQPAMSFHLDHGYATCSTFALRLGLGLLATALGLFRKPLSNMALRSGLRDLSRGGLAVAPKAGEG